jgi:hypothetical protein
MKPSPLKLGIVGAVAYFTSVAWVLPGNERWSRPPVRAVDKGLSPSPTGGRKAPTLVKLCHLNLVNPRLSIRPGFPYCAKK